MHTVNIIVLLNIIIHKNKKSIFSIIIIPANLV